MLQKNVQVNRKNLATPRIQYTLYTIRCMQCIVYGIHCALARAAVHAIARVVARDLP